MAVIHDKDRLEGATSLQAWKDAAAEQLEGMQAGCAARLANSADTAGSADSKNPEEAGGVPAGIRLRVAPVLSRRAMAMAVRYSLYLLEKRAPGPGVEVRVAPYAAVKVLEGPASDPHNLTPPDVIELEPAVWLRLACGVTRWQEEKDAGHITAVGPRDDLHRFLPLV